MGWVVLEPVRAELLNQADNQKYEAQEQNETKKKKQISNDLFIYTTRLS